MTTKKKSKPVKCPWCGGEMVGGFCAQYWSTRAQCDSCFAFGPAPKWKFYMTETGAKNASLRACVRKLQAKNRATNLKRKQRIR